MPLPWSQLSQPRHTGTLSFPIISCNVTLGGIFSTLDLTLHAITIKYSHTCGQGCEITAR